ncbi:MAG: DUF4389 domain-containing protein [Gammaproteobacteria bacterium]|nr:DUF4389 domain-containing protein [Gammaproteobacteria bacterium]
MDQATKDRMTDRGIWIRALYAVFFAITYPLAKTIIMLVVIFQFIAALISGSVNEALLRLGANLSTYVYQVLQFLTFNDETLPFPFSDWPDQEPSTDSPWIRSDKEEASDANIEETSDTDPAEDSDANTDTDTDTNTDSKR